MSARAARLKPSRAAVAAAHLGVALNHQAYHGVLHRRQVAFVARLQPQLAAAGLAQRARADGAHLAARLQQRRAQPHRRRAGAAAGSAARGNVREGEHAVAWQDDGANQG